MDDIVNWYIRGGRVYSLNLCTLDFEVLVASWTSKKLVTHLAETYCSRKLSYGVTGIELKQFKSFLKVRTQYVKYKASKSHMKCVLYGVPQGNYLSPILLLLHVNDISNCFDCVECVLYADDTNLFVESDIIIGLYMLGNQAVIAYNDWFLANSLTICENKTRHVIFIGNRKSCHTALKFIGLMML